VIINAWKRNHLKDRIKNVEMEKMKKIIWMVQRFRIRIEGFHKTVYTCKR
jgi:hypothetical protein